MNIVGEISFFIVILTALASVYLMLRPRNESFFSLEKKWVAAGGFIILLLATVLFYMSGFQTNNVVQTFTINGVEKTFTMNTLDLAGNTYFLLVNFLALFGSLFYIVCMAMEAGLLGNFRQNKRTNRQTSYR